MGISPFYVGQTAPTWTPTIVGDSGTPTNLTGATSFVLIIRDVKNATGERTGGGTVSILNAVQGSISYPWASADSAVAGSYTLQFKWVPSGGGLQFTDPIPWEVKIP